MKTGKKHLALAIVMALSLSHCTFDDSTRTRAEGAGFGAVVGGALGYLVGGRDGAAIGAVVGGGIGFAVGNDVAKRKRSYVNREDALDGEIAYYRKLNRSVAQTNRALSRDVAKLNRASRVLRRQYANGKVTKRQMLAERRAVHERYKKNQKYIANLKKQYQQGSDYLNSDLKRGTKKSKVSQLRRQQNHLRNEIQKAQRYQKQYARIEQRMSV